MKGELTFLLGRAATGKSERIAEKLKAHQRAGERAVLIVPEQYTYMQEMILTNIQDEAKHELADALHGLLGIQVFSFQRLCERVLQLHGRTHPFLNTQGYRMVIRRAIDKKQKELKLFRLAGEQAGFAEEAQSIFQDFKRAGLTPDALDELIVRLPEDAPLTEKLGDLSILYRETEAYLQERYLSMDDAADAAAKLLPESFVAGLPVYIDGMDRPGRQEYMLIETLLDCCPGVTISLRVNAEPSDDDDLFDPDRQVLYALNRLGERLGVTMHTVYCKDQSPRYEPLMRHIERNLFAYPAAVYRVSAEKLTIFGASDRRSEAEALAGEIQRLAREKIRYRDMAIIVSDLDAYAHLVRRACERRKIPVFLDRKRPLVGHAAIDAVLSAVRFVSNGYPPSELLKLIKSGYTDCTQDDAEELDLYLRRTGMRGNQLLKPFHRADPSEGAERARATVADALASLSMGLAHATVSEQVRALYRFLQETALQRRLEARAESLGRQERVAEMEEHAQVWNLLIELLDQLDAILGENKVGRKGFLSLLEEGLSGGSIGIVPGTADQGLVGDVVRTRSKTVRALFIIGANEGLLPRPRQNDGLIDDRELAELRAQGSGLRLSAPELSSYDRLDLYTAISKTTEYLYVSYAYGDAGGELAPAPIVERLQTVCPNCTIKNDIETSDAPPDCAAQALTLVASDLRRFRDDNIVAERLPAMVELLSEQADTRNLVDRMMQECFGRFGTRAIAKEAAATLYGKTVPMSASRLESFNNCPFQHFVRYGLAAQEVQEFTERAMDLGSFYHAALEAFVNTVIQRKLDWNRLSEETVFGIVDETLPGVIAAHNYGILTENERLRATLFLLIEVVRQSALAITRQIGAGSFVPIETEVRFGAGAPFPPIRLTLPDGREALVGGKIDRIDRAHVAEGDCLRVIDYKTGGRAFDFTGVLAGLTLQLPLYLLAATGRAKLRAGMYYMPVTQPNISDTEDDIEAALNDAFRLQGLTLSETEIVRASERHMDGVSAVLGGVKTVGDGAYTGSVCSRAEMDELVELARRKSEETLRHMLDGEMDASPAARKKNREACKYCDYRSICRFDLKTPGCSVRQLKSIKQKEFFELIGGGEADALDG